jgi:HEAT repeat protein
MNRNDAVAPDPAKAPRTKFARSLGNAMGLLKRVVSGKADRRAARPAKAGAPTAPVRSVSEFERGRRHLKDEIARLERELDGVYARITSGAFASGPGGGGPTIDRLMQQSRDLRERIQDARLDLARVERHLARERRLHPSPSGSAAPAGRAPRTVAPTPERSTELGASGRRREFRHVLERGAFESRSERAVFESLVRGLTAENPDLRRDAVARLGERRTAVAVELLLLGSDDADKRVRIAALNGLIGSRGRNAIARFRRALRSKDARERLAGLRGLSQIDGQLETHELVDALDDSDPATRKTAASLLCWHAVDNALRPLLLALRDEEGAVRAAAAESLGVLGDHRAVLALVRLLADEQEHVRAVAEQALRMVLDDDILEVGRGLDGEQRVEAIKQWWQTARVEKAMKRMGLEVEPVPPPPKVDFGALEQRPSLAAPAKPEKPKPKPSKAKAKRGKETKAEPTAVEPDPLAAMLPDAEAAGVEAAAIGEDADSEADNDDADLFMDIGEGEGDTPPAEEKSKEEEEPEAEEEGEDFEDIF